MDWAVETSYPGCTLQTYYVRVLQLRAIRSAVDQLQWGEWCILTAFQHDTTPLLEAQVALTNLNIERL